jgi:16S rRNA (guanine966-N2)-methyltransferase
MDQVRGAIFSSLAERTPDARVLDLFAGAGGLGIEALSRGARETVFVERDRRAIDVIRRNLEKTRLSAAAQVICLDAFTFLNRLNKNGAPGGGFDLIFADPPYTSAAQPEDFAARLLDHAGLAAALSPGGTFVLEKSPHHALAIGDAWEIRRQKRYGSAEVLFLEARAPVSPEDSTEPESLKSEI